jgi:hypothetical protein
MALQDTARVIEETQTRLLKVKNSWISKDCSWGRSVDCGAGAESIRGATARRMTGGRI